MTDQPQSQKPAGVPEGIEVKRPGYSLFVRISEDRMECRCSYVPREQGTMMTRDELAGFLSQYNVRYGIDQQALDDFAVQAAGGRPRTDVLLASGTPPVDGADEYILVTVQPSSIVQSGSEDVTGVDMHIVQTFLNVSYGDEIGRIIPAEAGVAGRNITGLQLAARAGKPLQAAIGRNIRVEDNGALLIAAAAGRFCQTSGEVSVEEEYLVKGDVNFRIGSIDFKGVVEVRGDVLDNFDVTATKGLTVTGNIGVSTVISAGDITFCGMDGQGKGRVTCGGTLHAHFIHDAEVECDGDVLVDVEVRNCIIRSRGRIIVEKGAISGGSCVALGGIEAKKLGSPSALHTRLHAGADYRSVGQLEEKLAELAELRERIRQTKSAETIAGLNECAAAVTSAIMELRAGSVKDGNAKINVSGMMYENVQLLLGGTVEETREEMAGPLSIIENSAEGGLRYLAMTGLDVPAACIEKACLLDLAHNG